MTDSSEKKDEKNFYQEILESLQQGYTITPLLGSGISYQSGILLGSQINDYLCFVFYKLFLEDDDSNWNFFSSGWPNFPSEEKPYSKLSEKDKCINKILDYYKDICNNYGCSISGEYDSEEQTADLSINMAGYIDDENRNFGASSTDDALIKSHEHISAYYLNRTFKRPICPSIIPLEKNCQVKRADENLQNLHGTHFLKNDTLLEEFQTEHILSEQARIKEIGLRSLHDWRAILSFLARLAPHYNSKNYYLKKTPDQKVIDSFNRFMVGDRYPNQNHQLLTQLARPLHFRILLTTNFDTLTEQAFQLNNLNLKVLSLGLNYQLPSSELLGPHPTLIKLHGEVMDTRADHSLDSKTSDRDRYHFIHYLSSSTANKRSAKSHLLVIGTSLSDRRIRDLIIAAIESIPDLKIFVIIHGAGEKDRLINLFKHETANNRKPEDYFIFSAPGKSEYCLYELYQRVTLSLPSGGVYYQYHHFTPPTPPPKPTTDAHNNSHLSDITNDIYNYLYGRMRSLKPYEKEGVKGKEHEIVTIDNTQGATLLAINLFEKLEGKRKKCLWFELEDYSSVSLLISEIYAAILSELGRFHQDFVFSSYYNKPEPTEDFISHIKHLENQNIMIPKDWAIFIYGRNPPGECSGFSDIPWCKEINVESIYEELHKFIRKVSGLHITIIYLPFTQNRLNNVNGNISHIEEEMDDKKIDSISLIKNIDDSKDEKYLKEIYNEEDKNKDDSEGESKNKNKTKTISTNSEIKSTLDEFIEKYIEKTSQEDIEDATSYNFQRARFIYASTLFRQSRHLSALLSEGVFPCENRFNTDSEDNDKNKSEKVLNWRKELTEIGVFFKKPGGYVWKYRDIRIATRLLFENHPNFINKNRKTENKTEFLIRSSKMNFLIANWYFSAFLSTLNSDPLVESMYHRFACIRMAGSAMPTRELPTESTKKEIKEYQLILIIKSLTELTKTILIAKETSIQWLNAPLDLTHFSIRSIHRALTHNLPIKKTKKTKENEEYKNDTEEQIRKNWANDTFIGDWLTFLGIKDAKSDHKFRIKTLVDKLLNCCQSIDASIKYENGDAIFRTLAPAFDKPEYQATELDYKELENLLNYRSNNTETMMKEIINKLSTEGQKLLSNISDSDKDQADIFKHAIKGFLCSDKKIENKIPTKGQKSLDNTSNSDKDQADISKHITEEFLRKKIEHREFTTKVRENISTIQNAYFNKPGELLNLIAYYSDSSYLLIKITKRLEQFNQEQENEKIGTPKKTTITQKLWATISVLCNTILSNMNLLDYTFRHRELELKSKTLALYGLSLAYLNRFHEAHRRLNEASAVDALIHLNSNITTRPATNIRRAEAHICEARAIYLKYEKALEDKKPSFSEKELEKTYRKYINKLDDGFITLENIKKELTGNCRSTLWWNKLYQLQLELYSEYQPPKLNPKDHKTPLMFFEKKNYIKFFTETLSNGVFVSSGNPYRKLTFIMLYIKALESYKKKYNNDKEFNKCLLNEKLVRIFLTSSDLKEKIENIAHSNNKEAESPEKSIFEKSLLEKIITKAKKHKRVKK